MDTVIKKEGFGHLRKI